MKQTKEIYGVVYRITNRVNGKCYHGQTVNPKERWSHHLRSDSHCIALRNAIRKYGRGSFLFEVIAEAISKGQLDQLEIEFVKTSLAPHGYNLKEGGANGRPSEQTRRKLSLSGKEAQNRPEVRERNSAGVRRNLADPEVRERRRLAQKAAQNRPEVKARKRATMLEVHSRPGEAERRSLKLKEVWASYSDEDRKRRVASAAAMRGTDEYRRNMSAAVKRALSDPEVKSKMIAAQKASFTPERRIACSKSCCEIWTRPGERKRRGRAISKAHNTPEGKRKLAMRRRSGESEEAWRKRIHKMVEPAGRA